MDSLISTIKNLKPMKVKNKKVKAKRGKGHVSSNIIFFESTDSHLLPQISF